MTEIILRKDSEWSDIDGEVCRVINFTPFAKVENGKVVTPNLAEPYASVNLECKKLPQQATGFITHKVDFQHLWAAFRDREIGENEEVLISWSKKHLKTPIKIFSSFMPKIWVMVCRKGAFDLITDPNHRPNLTGEARFNAERPIAEWKPESN